jgi:hypothetical protein
MDPSHLKITKTKKTKKVIIPPSVMINQPNLRQILLDKLMKHRKTQKRVEPSIMNNNFDEQCSFPVIPDMPVESQPEPEPISLKDKPYGVLKNGLKPTFKTWNKSQKNINGININEISPTCSNPILEIKPVEIAIPKEVQIDPPAQILMEPMNEDIDKLEKHPVKVGKSKKNKTVQIWIACHKTRKQKEENHDAIRKTNLTTVKNYLKNHRLIKVGSTAPTNLIRQIYENAKLYGDVVNENKQNLLYNYEKDSKESV